MQITGAVALPAFNGSGIVVPGTDTFESTSINTTGSVGSPSRALGMSSLSSKRKYALPWLAKPWLVLLILLAHPEITSRVISLGVSGKSVKSACMSASSMSSLGNGWSKKWLVRFESTMA